MIVVCISDTHGMHRQIKELPYGDVLIHAGDGLGVGTLAELEDLDDWFGGLPHPHKIVIAGNHDWCFEDQPETARQLVKNAVYLQDSGVEIEGIRFWGSPWTPFFRNWAFNLPRGNALAKRWAQIPDDTDVLITHGPPWGILDEVKARFQLERVGCKDLRERVLKLKIQAHVFGHVHEGYGQTWDGEQRYVNACTCNLRYEPVNEAISFEIARRN